MSPLERHHYVVRVLRMPGIPKAVLNCIEDHADKDGGCYLLQSTIAAETGFSERSIRSALTFLSKHGLALWVRHGHHASTFQLTLEAFQKAKSRPATRADYNRQPVPTEVGPKKRKTKNLRHHRSHCVHCGVPVKVAAKDHQGFCTACWRDRKNAPTADVIKLFPEAKARP